MAIRQFSLLSIVTLLSASVILGQDDTGVTADQLVAKNIEAKGGAAAIQGLKTLKLTGKLLVNGGQLQLAYLQTKKQPGEVRTEATLQGMTLVQRHMTGRKAGRFLRFKAARIPKNFPRTTANH